MADSPGSPLSSLASDDFTEDMKMEDPDANIDALHGIDAPPSKRQRTGSAWDPRAAVSQIIERHEMRGNETESDISSDTSGDVPGSPGNLSQLQDEDGPGHEQITICRWEGCPLGDLGNMDSLVHHIHEDHIGSRQKKYSCEWDDCTRKGMPHASGYALRAHMRSHTREKPFYCALPECDRSFTRSDALAKHMRTVHETEALRPSDPVPKNHSNPAPGRLPRLKLVFSAKPPEDLDQERDTDDDATIGTNTDIDNGASPRHRPTPTYFEPYPEELEFSRDELALPTKELFRLLRRQLHWTEEEHLELQAEVDALEASRKQEWMDKELLLENVMEAEFARHSQRDSQKPNVSKFKNLPNSKLPLTGGNSVTPWWRKQAVKTEETATSQAPDQTLA
ncbi:MAG: hypothetical protein M4579_003720 [Chaenotheca gracillima]|nr:MAG: hypothetical protein M4579_003720 [Chaenotheca gracillima]